MFDLTKTRKKYPYFILVAAIILFLAVNVRMNLFSYNNFDMGKFDLGNMAQMLWNTEHGRFMYLTDYFGTNLPRWSMSHVDPILLLFLPIFAIFPHPLTLVFSQLLIVLLSALLIYEIAYLNIKSRFISLMLGLTYLCYPAVGFLTSRTGFHGVTAAIPFFLFAVYVYEYIYHKDIVTKKLLVMFWTAIIITISGKEQIPLYTFLFGLYILLFRLPAQNRHVVKKHAVVLCAISLVWFVTAFFVIIPAFAGQRIAGYDKFARSLGIENKDVRNVGLSNYFLSRYDALGDSYTDIITGILLKPNVAIKIVFGGDKLDNFNMTFGPILYLPFASPQILVMAFPDLLINYLTTASGVGTSEIQNHRISMIVPVLFLSLIFAFGLLSKLFNRFTIRKVNAGYMLASILSVVLLMSCINASFQYQNPVFMWLRDSIVKHLPTFVANAKSDSTLANNKNLKIGDIVKVSPLENKDRECAKQIVRQIPDNVSVSGPDYLGAHLSLRETYAIFPALYNEADYVIIDVFSKKIANILDLPTDLINDVVNRVIKSKDYSLQTSCGNLFVYKKMPQTNATDRLPIQERFRYAAKYDFPILSGMTVVDYTLPLVITRGQQSHAQIVYLKKDKLDNNFFFLSFINVKTGNIYQAANLPSFAIETPQDWKEDYYYIEDLNLVLPTFVDEGDYRVFLGMTNNIKTRSIYLGDITLK